MAKIKIMPKKDLGQFVTLACDAFPGMGHHTQKEKNKLIAPLQKRYDVPYVTFIGSYEKNELLGGMIIYDFEMNLFGHKVTCGGGGFLSVSLLHKKEYVARDLCRYYFRNYRKAGAPVAALYPFRPDFYRKMGVGYSSKASFYRFAPKSLPYNGDKKYLRELTKKDANKIIKCFNEYADQTHGMIYDDKNYRGSFLRQNEKSRMIGYEKNKKLEGYLVYSFKQEKPEYFIDNEIEIVEFVWHNKEAFLSLCSYLHTQQDQIPIIRWLTFDDNVQFLLGDPLNDSGNFYPSVFHETNRAALGPMLRLLNPKQLFKLLDQHDFNGETLRVGFNIIDSFLKENSGKFVVYFEDGYATVQKNNAPIDVELSGEIADFSSLLLGVVELKSLNQYGLIKVSREKYLNRLSRLFKAEQKPICMIHF